MKSCKSGNTPYKGVDRMDVKKEKKLSREDIKKMEREEQVKYEIADELGLLDRVLEEGWRSLSSKETGRIGGLMSKNRKREG